LERIYGWRGSVFGFVEGKKNGQCLGQKLRFSATKGGAFSGGGSMQ